MVRDIRDVVASGWSSEQAHNKQWCIDNFQDKAKNYAKLIMDIASQRVVQLKAAMKFAPGRLRIVHYEDLINSVETEMMTLTEWLTGRASPERFVRQGRSILLTMIRTKLTRDAFGPMSKSGARSGPAGPSSPTTSMTT